MGPQISYFSIQLGCVSRLPVTPSLGLIMSCNSSWNPGQRLTYCNQLITEDILKATGEPSDGERIHTRGEVPKSPEQGASVPVEFGVPHAPGK